VNSDNCPINSAGAGPSYGGKNKLKKLEQTNPETLQARYNETVRRKKVSLYITKLKSGTKRGKKIN